MNEVPCPSWSKPKGSSEGVCAEKVNGSARAPIGKCVLQCRRHDGQWRRNAETLMGMSEVSVKGKPLDPLDSNDPRNFSGGCSGCGK